MTQVSDSELRLLHLRASALSQMLNSLIQERSSDVWVQKQADTTWWRYNTVIDFITQDAGGLVAASIARTLVEEAIIWEWAVSSGLGHDAVAVRAADEHRRLSEVAEEGGDTVWLGWLLPPGTTISIPQHAMVPSNVPKMLPRFGTQLDSAISESVHFRGLKTIYTLLGTVAHSSLTAAFIMAESGGATMPLQFAAAAIQLAAAGAVASISTILELAPGRRDTLNAMVVQISTAATKVHGLQGTSITLGPKATKTSGVQPVMLEAVARNMPPVQETLVDAAREFVDLAQTIATAAARDFNTTNPEFITVQAIRSFQLAHEQMMTLMGMLDNQVSPAILPFASRAVLEDGARWSWMMVNTEANNADGSTLRAFVADGKKRMSTARSQLRSVSIAEETIESLFGSAAIGLTNTDPGEHTLPHVNELLSMAYRNEHDIEVGRIFYGILSQFHHATPLATLHIQPANLAIVSAPMHAVSVDAMCRGLLRIFAATTTIACRDARALIPLFESLSQRKDHVSLLSSSVHLIG